MELTVARPEDADAVLRLRDEAAEWLLSRGVRQWTPGELPRSVVERRIAARSTFVLRSYSDALEATVTIDFADEHTWGHKGADGTAGYVHTLVVRPDLVGAGRGRRIVAWAENLVRDNGRTCCRLDCAESNAALSDWYRSLGYRRVGRRDYGEAWFPVVLFERPL